MKILFFGRHYTYFRNFEAPLRELASRGHQLHLAVERDEVFGGRRTVEMMAADHPTITFGLAPSRADDDSAWAASCLRLGLDYLRYQHPIFDTKHKLRIRALERTPRMFVALGDVVRTAGGWSRRLASAIIHRVERAAPDVPAIRAFIEAQAPDIVLVTPLVDLGSSQIDYLRTAQALGIPTALCVWSWDHLSAKALIRDWPERVFVWNQYQKKEATDLHGLPAERVVVTGAQCFDRWFDQRPSRTREQFCREVGLPADRPFLLYVGSTFIHGSASEVPFILEWIRQIRQSDSPTLREAGILIRPHPARWSEWDGIDLAPLNAVAWGGNPVDEQAKADYFDSLYHSTVVVGMITSALIEAGIVGRPVFTLLVPEHEANLLEVVHFDYLVKVGGGLLTVARGFPEHLAHLAEAVTHPTSGIRPFVKEFVRPYGLETPATPVFVAEIERMQGLPVEPPRRDPLAPVWRGLFGALTRTRGRDVFDRWTSSAREYASLRDLRDKKERKAIERAMRRAELDQARQQRLEQRARTLEAQRQAREAAMAEKERRRLEKMARLADKRRRAEQSPATHGGGAARG